MAIYALDSRIVECGSSEDGVDVGDQNDQSRGQQQFLTSPGHRYDQYTDLSEVQDELD